MKKWFYLLLLILGISTQTFAQQSYYWVTENDGPSIIPGPDTMWIRDMQIVSMEEQNYLVVEGRFYLGNQLTGLAFYNGTEWSNLRPTEHIVIDYVVTPFGEYIGTNDGLFIWNGIEWESALGATNEVDFLVYDSQRNQIVFSELGEGWFWDAYGNYSFGNMTYLYAYNGVSESSIGSFRGWPIDAAQTGSQLYVGINAYIDDTLGGYETGVYQIDLASLQITNANLPPDYAAPYFQVETYANRLYAGNVVLGLYYLEDNVWHSLDTLSGYFSFSSSTEGMVLTTQFEPEVYEIGPLALITDGNNYDTTPFAAANETPIENIVKFFDGEWFACHTGPAFNVSGSFLQRRTLSTGIIDSEHKTLKVYPNPATTTVTVEVTNINYPLTIISLTGEKVEVPITQIGNKFIFDVSSLPRGLYLVGSEKIILQ